MVKKNFPLTLVVSIVQTILRQHKSLRKVTQNHENLTLRAGKFYEGGL